MYIFPEASYCYNHEAKKYLQYKIQSCIVKSLQTKIVFNIKLFVNRKNGLLCKEGINRVKFLLSKVVSVSELIQPSWVTFFFFFFCLLSKFVVLIFSDRNFYVQDVEPRSGTCTCQLSGGFI